MTPSSVRNVVAVSLMSHLAAVCRWTDGPRLGGCGAEPSPGRGADGQRDPPASSTRRARPSSPSSAQSSAKPGRTPRHSRSATSCSSGTSSLQRREAEEQVGVFAARPQALHEAGRPRRRKAELRPGRPGWPRGARTWPARWRPTSLPSRGCRESRRPQSPDQRQPVGDGRRRHAELADHAGLVQDDVPAAVPGDDLLARPPPARGPCPASRARPGRRRARRGSERRRRRSRRRPRTPPCGQTTRPSARAALLGEVELGQQVGVDAGARLVAGVQLVAERLDDVVEGAGDVRHARRREEHPEAAQQADRRADLTAPRSLVAAARRSGCGRARRSRRRDGSSSRAQAPNLRSARSCALAASVSRSLGVAVVTSEPRSSAEAAATASTARSKAASLAADGSREAADLAHVLESGRPHLRRRWRAARSCRAS